MLIRTKKKFTRLSLHSFGTYSFYYFLGVATLVGCSLAVWAAPIPERVLLSLTADPVTSMAVTWRTDESIDVPQAQVMRCSPTPKTNADLRAIVGKSEQLELEVGTPVYHHEVVIEGLEGDTQYAYRVGDGTVWSPWRCFTTASSAPQPFTFLYLGDMQNEIDIWCHRTCQSAVIRHSNIDFMVHAGDLVAEGYDDWLWGQWAESFGFITAWLPNLCTPGNHDWYLDKGKKVTADRMRIHPLWRMHFAFPLTGPSDTPALEETAYYLDYQGVRFISLDSNMYANDNLDEKTCEELGKCQADWLRTVLAENPCLWTIVVQHHPLYSVGKDRDNVHLREVLLPLYDEYGIDLVLQGHDHYYARTHKLRGGQIVDPDIPGTIYVVSVAGPKMYPKNPKFESLMAVMDGNKQMYQIITIDNTTLRYEAFSIDGLRVDGFELHKQEKGNSILKAL